MYWPWPPMLNIPQRKAKATASAVRMIGVVKSSVCCRFVRGDRARVPREPHVTASRTGSGRSSCRPGRTSRARPGEDRVVDADRALPGQRDDETAHEEGEERREDGSQHVLGAAEPPGEVLLGRRRDPGDRLLVELFVVEVAHGAPLASSCAAARARTSVAREIRGSSAPTPIAPLAAPKTTSSPPW